MRMNNVALYEIHAEIENRCNQNCLHCSSKLLREGESIEYSIENLSHFIKGLNSKAHLYLTGGEPLLYLNLDTVLQKLRAAAPLLSIGVFTCGVCLDNSPISQSYAQTLKSSGLEDCYVSLYHIDPIKHDTITGLSGSFEITCESIKNLQSAGIEVKGHLVLTKYNITEIHDVLKQLTTFFSQTRILRIVNTGNASVNWEKIGVAYHQQNQTIQEIINKIESYDHVVTISGFPSQLACRPFPNARKCQAGLSLFYISGKGGVYPCACTKNNDKFLLGDIRHAETVHMITQNLNPTECRDTCLNPILEDN